MLSINYYVCSFRPVTMMNNNDSTMWDIHHLANSHSLGRGSSKFLYCLFLNNGPFWFQCNWKKPKNWCDLCISSLSYPSAWKPAAGTQQLNFSLSSAAGTLERQSRDLGLSSLSLRLAADRKIREKKINQVSWTSGAVCKMWALSSVLPGTSGLSWTDPQYLPTSYQHNSLWFPHYHFAHQWMCDGCCLLPSTLHFFLQMDE